MRKILVNIILFSLFQFSAAYSASSDHLTKLKSKYPYGLLSDDYGILTLNDLALNACYIKPAPFVPGELNPYEYWLCFESKSISPECEDQNFSNEDGHVGRVAIDAIDHQIVYRFIESRPWGIRSCKNFVKTLKSLIRETSHACISASYIGKEEKNDQGHMERIGIFNRLKTRNGCEGRGCVFNEKIRRDNCPDLKL